MASINPSNEDTTVTGTEINVATETSEITNVTDTNPPEKTETVETPEIDCNVNVRVINYTDKSVAVVGDTKFIKDKLKSLGGRFNRSLKERPDEGFEGGAGWIFSRAKTDVDHLRDVVDTVDNTDPTALSMCTSLDSVPDVYIQPVQPKYQMVKYRVYRPDVGMTVSVSTGSMTVNGEVIKIETHKDIVDTVIMKCNGDKGKMWQIVIINGQWKVMGLMSDHRVRFE